MRPLALLSRLRFRLLAFNALLVFMPAAGVLFLDTYERQLLADQERSMVEQGRVLAAALSARGALSAEDATRTLVQLRQRTGARIRVIDRSGGLLVDTSRLGPRREADAEPAEAAPRSSDHWLYRVGSAPVRWYRGLFRPPEPPLGSADLYAASQPITGPEVRAALAGRYGAASRISSGGQRSVTLYSALPISNGGEIVGAVLVSQSTYRILRKLHDVRLDVFRVFLASLGAAVVLSLLLSRTIARPLSALRDQADALLDGRGRLSGRFHARRRDEIGDLARTLERLRERLQQHILEVESFASDVSHELKNPLASIRNAADMLAEVEDEAERGRFLEMIRREVARMEHALSGVHEISRIDARAGDDGEALDLAELLGGIAEAHRLRGGCPVRLASEGDAPRVFGSPERLTQVFENVIDNAASYSGPGDVVDVRIAREGDQALVRVIDAGPGVPPAHRERIFDRFFSYRPDESDSASRHTGLGLAIVKAIVDRAGGSVRALDAEDGGACFEIRLPLLADAPARR